MTIYKSKYRTIKMIRKNKIIKKNSSRKYRIIKVALFEVVKKKKIPFTTFNVTKICFAKIFLPQLFLTRYKNVRLENNTKVNITCIQKSLIYKFK